jgi:hypothetical protein
MDTHGGSAGGAGAGGGVGEPNNNNAYADLIQLPPSTTLQHK